MKQLLLKRTTLPAVLILSALSFAAHAAQPGSADALAIGRGAKAWGDNCNRCHNMRAPKELRDDQWRAVVSHMRVRAGLTGEEARNILLFLQASN